MKRNIVMMLPISRVRPTARPAESASTETAKHGDKYLTCKLTGNFFPGRTTIVLLLIKHSRYK